MEQNKENLMELINEFRKWNEEWMANPSIKVRSLKSVDEFAENLSEKYTLIKKKQSSIDWLAEQRLQGVNLDDALEQAKAMHKEEMANTWIKACEDILSAIENDTVASFSSEELFEQYYNETFGGEDENNLEEKLYTKDEVLDLLVNMNSWPTTFEGKEDITEWFEQGQYY